MQITKTLDNRDAVLERWRTFVNEQPSRSGISTNEVFARVYEHLANRSQEVLMPQSESTELIVDLALLLRDALEIRQHMVITMSDTGAMVRHFKRRNAMLEKATAENAKKEEAV